MSNCKTFGPTLTDFILFTTFVQSFWRSSPHSTAHFIHQSQSILYCLCDRVLGAMDCCVCGGVFLEKKSLDLFGKKEYTLLMSGISKKKNIIDKEKHD